MHFSPPDDSGDRDLWELAYIELSFHPNKQAVVIPEEADVVIRTDSVLPENSIVDGERGLTTIEYWADERTDLHIHFHENRSELPPEESSDGGRGNVTDSTGWLRGLPKGSLSEGEIERVFRMLGSDGSQSQLPGELPQRLGFIIGIKNFSRDDSENVDDPLLVNDDWYVQGGRCRGPQEDTHHSEGPAHSTGPLRIIRTQWRIER